MYPPRIHRHPLVPERLNVWRDQVNAVPAHRIILTMYVAVVVVLLFATRDVVLRDPAAVNPAGRAAS